MRPIFLALLTLISLGVCAEETSTDVVLHGPSGWTLIGEASTHGVTPDMFSLEPGAQLFRIFGSEVILVEMSSRPVFGVDPSYWPVIEIGSDALVFARLGEKGRLVLASETRAPFVFPLEFELDEDAASRDFVSVGFEHSGRSISVSIGGDSWRFTTSEDGAGDLAVVVSAGIDDPWLFECFAVRAKTFTTSTEQPIRDEREAGDRMAGSFAFTSESFDQPAAANVGATDGRQASGVTSVVAEEATVSRSAQPKGTLEIFTPPSVRHGRTAGARADAARVLDSHKEGAQ